MGAKSKPVEVMSGDSLGLDAGEVGFEGSKTEVTAAEERPPKQRGEVVTDDGNAHLKLADFLQERKFI
jgi:electron transfer flavoprotein beta subunit